MSEPKSCPKGHPPIRNKHHQCRECVRLRSIAYQHTEQGKKAARRSRAKRLVRSGKEAGIDGDIRREIENRRLDKELESLING